MLAQVLYFLLPLLVQPIQILRLLNSDALMQQAETLSVWPAFSSIDGCRLGALALMIMSMVVVLWVRGKETPPATIPDLPSRMVWEELTSPSDIVGSMSVPPLPARVRALALPGLRNGIIDHFLRSHLGRTGAFRVLIAETLLDASRFATAERPMRYVALEQSLADLSGRSYRLRGLLLMSALGLTLGFPLVMGGSVLAVAVSVWWLYVIVAVLAAIGAALWWFFGAHRRIVSYRANTELPVLVPLNRRYVRVLWILGIFAGFAGFAEVFVTRSLSSISPSQIGGSLLCLGICGLVAACLASVSVRPSVMVFLVLPALLFGVLPVYATSTVAMDGTVSGVLAAFFVMPGVALGCVCVILAAIAVTFGLCRPTLIRRN